MTDPISSLDAALAGTEPLTEDEVARALRIISKRAWDATREHNQLVRRLGDVEAKANHAHDTALAESYVMHPDRRVAHHDAIARLAAEEHRSEADALALMERSLRKEMEVLEKLIGALQTQASSLRGVAA